jgi:hypothetical protein
MSRQAAGAVFTIMVLTVPARMVSAQAVLLQAGSSSLFDARGGAVEFRGPTSSISISAGQLQKQFVIGALLKKRTRAGTVRLGDDFIDLSLPTDVFDGARYIPIRGGGLELTRSQFHVVGMLGGTSINRGAPFFRGAKWDSPIGALFMDRALAARWHVFSRNAFSSRQTSIHGVEWRATDSLKLATAAGIGTGQPYVAASATLEERWLSASAAYARPHEGFGRVVADSPMTAEHEAENLSVTLRPRSWWSLSGTRQHFVNTPPDRAADRVAVNQFGASLNTAGFRMGTTVFESRGGAFSSRGASFSVARSVTDSVDVTLDHFRSVSAREGSSTTVASLRETITPRLSLLQVVSSAGKRPSLSLGGQLLTNPVTVIVSYQTVYAPFRIGNPFVQSLGLDLRLQVVGNLQLQVGTYTAPDGGLRYTISASQWLTRSGTGGHDGAGLRAFRLPKYIVRGRVVDAEGHPIDGAAVRVGLEDLVTDREGCFSVRARKPARLVLSVLTERFTAPGRFSVVSAPTRVTPADDEHASDVVIVVRRN